MARQQSNHTFAEISPITECVRVFFKWLTWLSPMQWLSHLFPLLRSRSRQTVHQGSSEADTLKTLKSARAIERYVLVCWLLGIIFVFITCLRPLPTWVVILLAILASLRIIEIIQVAVNAAFFDALDPKFEQLGSEVSTPRFLVLSGMNFLELIICFGIIYALNLSYLRGAGSPLTAFYFSIITQLTIGYGDVYPIAWLRIVAAVQGLINVLFIVLVFGRVIASLPSMHGESDKKM